jgi:hypothetical protein
MGDQDQQTYHAQLVLLTTLNEIFSVPFVPQNLRKSSVITTLKCTTTATWEIAAGPPARPILTLMIIIQN